MDTQTPETVPSAGSGKDTALILVAVALAIGGLWAFYFFNPDFNVLIRTLMLLGALVAAGAIGYSTAPGRELAGYVTGFFRIELRKIVWPTRNESLQATLMIAVFILIFGLILTGVDWALKLGVQALIGKGA